MKRRWRHEPVPHNNSFSTTGAVMTRRTGNVESFLTALEQFCSNRPRVVADQFPIQRAKEERGVLFECPPGHRPFGRSAHGAAIVEQLGGSLGLELFLKLHIRDDHHRTTLPRLPPRAAVEKAGPHESHTHKNEKQYLRPHASSSSICVPPALASTSWAPARSNRGSVASMDRKKPSSVTRSNRECLNTGS